MNQTGYLTNPSSNHVVQVCPNQNSQVDLVTRFIKDGLLNSEAVIIIAKPELRRILKLKMGTFNFNGLSFQDIQDQGQIKFFDAKFLLSNFISDGYFEERVFQEHIAAPIHNAQLNYRKVRVFNEMVDFFWKNNQYDMAKHLEVFWNNLSNTQEFSFLRTYSLDRLDPNTYDDAIERICKCHSRLIFLEYN